MKQQILIEKKYLRFPIRAGGTEREVHVLLNGTEIYRFGAALYTGRAEETCDFYGELPVGHLSGQMIEVQIDPAEDGSDPAILMEQTDCLSRASQDKYPYIHFAPTAGWMNDPNGLCWYKGEYHLFFQHNMFDVKWNDISWGHAVSRDLLHWEQVEEALMPDQYGACFSGSAITKEEGQETWMPGCPDDAMILLYTCAGGRTKWSQELKFTQKAAWSQDGRTFTRMEKPLIEHIVYENRDPKVYWNEEAKNYYLTLFLEEHDYAVFVSEDMKQWEMTQRLTIENWWECPDLRKLPVSGDENGKWMFWTPDGWYLVGEFDGRTFTPTQEIKCINGNDREHRKAYAAQTFWGIKDRVVQIPWMTVGVKQNLYSGIMGIPRELELLKQGEEYILAAHPVREVQEQMKTIWKNDSGSSEFVWSEDGAAVLHLENPAETSFSLEFCGVSIKWDAKKQQFTAGDLPQTSCDTIKNMTLIADKGILEISCNQDTVLYYIETEHKFRKALQLCGEAQAEFGIVE